MGSSREKLRSGPSRMHLFQQFSWQRLVKCLRQGGRATIQSIRLQGSVAHVLLNRNQLGHAIHYFCCCIHGIAHDGLNVRRGSIALTQKLSHLRKVGATAL
ncbi:hypothetical protein WJ47_02785 [Burkholderia ubonensis]|uniref:Uncharacterized protein n=1 Tax=Burkholderia ubonensis TaxID=101571 RepID=A0AB73FTN2_9BURK|nr:hypothetical protein WJ44_29335 [Burkholderia ubonensis]KVL72715.1 hypothetical protein WJ47_02785 [Burkholderia ubonensis]KVM23344.1 hypothetical protein WJ53_17855 [Burkholderia ubonensis]KVM29642.1 hypothetical protein WJ54_11790 [Burkholderia ubonensis]KVT81375.1 hypothetical protein WK59_18730 [Burkholderia ubonensis]